MSKLLDPKILMAIKELSLAAKTTIEGFINGINKSTIKGPGMEFSQYRSYQPGDDLRLLDWKMFARSDRYYIRESEIETNISIRLVIDASASMNHSDGDYTKIEYARYLAASLAYLGNLQGDAIGLNVFKSHEVISLPVKQDFQHLSRLFFQLEQIKPEGSFTKAAHYKQLYSGASQKELTIFITDLYQSETEIFDLLDTVSTLKHEVIVFHLMSANELALDFKGYSTFEDLETGATIQVDQSSIRKTYKAKLESYLEEVKTKALNKRIFYRMLSTDEPLEQALRDFLNQRKKLKV
ncbi:DUF58 domain-containing protein [Pedobacter duraquae]|uniref:Uncharacterized protein DUF58 n=1 Tax=Pedobacter duraquae TaxID=425511 RepID=A0A4R6IL59_9SPHI|nr:DUF58 domain-containing protein [Pedobacter duraquae]TDO22854.1 uncharacterized protein DUF58 [Pedobacter duraquae]